MAPHMCGARLPEPRGDGGRGADLSGQADHHHRSGSAGRRHRLARTHAGAAVYRGLGPTGGGGNKPGANNQIAAEYVAKSPADGHTLLIGPEVTFVVNPSLYRKLSYDPVNDFTPITGLVTINHALIVNPSLPVDSAKDLIALAKAKPGTLNYGTFGVGSSGHLNMELLQALADVKLQPVHYKGATPALTD